MQRGLGWTRVIRVSHVLRLGSEQVEQALLGGGMAGNEQVLVFGPVGEAAREVIFLEGLGIADATVEEVVGVRKADYHRTHQDELADQRGILQSEIDG